MGTGLLGVCGSSGPDTPSFRPRAPPAEFARAGLSRGGCPVSIGASRVRMCGPVVRAGGIESNNRSEDETS